MTIATVPFVVLLVVAAARLLAAALTDERRAGAELFRQGAMQQVILRKCSGNR